MSVFTFDRPSHTYILDGQRLPHVTGILRDAGVIDTTWYTQEARDKGSIVHLATALYDRGKLNEAKFRHTYPECVGRFDAWLAFRTMTRCEIVAVEKPVYHPVWLYAGTLDRIIRWDSRLTLVDLKPPSKTHAQCLQTAALCEIEAIPSRGCVHLYDTGTFRWERHPDNYLGDFAEFLELLQQQQRQTEVLCQS